MHTWKARLALSLAAAATVTTAIASIGPARAEVESILSCDSIKPCLQWNNSGSGDSIKGVSTSGVALEGQTKFKSAGKTAGKSGVLGSDVSTTGTLNSGVSGASTNGTGVTGTSTAASGLNGVAGFSASTFASGVYGQDSSTGFGVTGRNTATAHNNAAAGVLADGGAANDALHATSISANAVYAFSQNGTPLFANQGANTSAPELYLQDTSSSNNTIIEAVGPSGDIFDVTSSGAVITHGNMSASGNIQVGGDASIDGSLRLPSSGGSEFDNSPGNLAPTLTIDGGGVNLGDTVLAVRDNNGQTAMDVTDTGEVGISGLLYTRGPCAGGCIVGNKRVRAVTEYAPVESEPTIEDNGEGALAGGFAYITLDPKFANVIDTKATYLVSVTPEGDCRGLYVAQRSARGFAVRELQGGSASVAFEYRIVAKRFGVEASRLPMTVVPVAVKPMRRH